MNSSELEQLTDAYICYWEGKYKADERGIVGGADFERHSWANDQIMELTDENPDELWSIIMKVLSKSQSNTILEILSAGPLEDYLARLGERVIDKVEKEAKLNPDFANLLGGVWQNSMSDEMWSRVQNVWDRNGWDGDA